MTKIILVLIFFSLISTSSANDKIDIGIQIQYKNALIEAHSSVLEELAINKELMSLLLNNQDHQKTLYDVIEKDNAWHLSKTLQNEIVDNTVATIFRQLVRDDKYSFSEFMLTDMNGGLLSAYPITSDYWQGDESKFIAPVRTGGIYISVENWDESTQSHSFFISIPIFNNKKFLGVLISGLDVTAKYLMETSLEDLIQLKINEKKE